MKKVEASQYCLRVTDGTHDSPKEVPCGKYLITSKHLRRFTLDFSAAYQISEHDYEKINERSRVEQWDILFSMIGTIGNLYLETHPTVDYACKNVGIFKMGGNKEKAIWLFYYLQSPEGRAYIHGHLRGTTQMYVPLDSLRQMPIPFPDEKSMKKINEILYSIDRKIELNSEINGCLLEQVFSKYDALFDDDDSFETLTVSSIGTVVGGGTPSKSKPEFYCEHGVAWVTPKDLSLDHSVFIERGNEDISELGLAKSGATIMPANTVLFSSRAPIGYTAISLGPISTNQGFKSVIPNPEIGPYFVYCFLKKNLETIEGMASGSTFKEVSGSIMKRVPVNVPNACRLRLFNEFAAPAFNTIKNNEAEIKRLTILRDSLLPKLMSGEIDVDSVEIG